MAYHSFRFHRFESRFIFRRNTVLIVSVYFQISIERWRRKNNVVSVGSNGCFAMSRR